MSKVYFDVGHFIAIPAENFTSRKKKGRPPKEQPSAFLDDNNNIIPEPRELLSEIMITLFDTKGCIKRNGFYSVFKPEILHR